MNFYAVLIKKKKNCDYLTDRLNQKFLSHTNYKYNTSD